MGGCCERGEVIEGMSNRSTSISRRSSILFEGFSRQSNYKKKFEYLQMLGCGAFGKVRLYRDRQGKMKYAIKTLRKNFFNTHNITSMVREVETLRSLDHPSIVNYFEVYEDDYFLHIVMEYIPGDNLFKMIQNKAYFSFTEKEIAQIMLCLMKAVLFLHLNHIIHRDLKPENILFAVPGQYQSIKVIDFGLAITRNAKRDNHRVGTPYYMAPEMLEGNFFYESDMWSIGVILFVMVSGIQPFKAKNKEKVFRKIAKGKYNKQALEEANCSKEVKELIRKILVPDYRKRISIETAINHPWFKIFENSSVKKIDQPLINAIKEFQKQNLLQKEILFYLAKLSNEAEVQKLKQAFEIIDKDNSGEIEYEEILKLFTEMGIKASEKELKEIFASLDFHSDGKINYSEFLAATLSSIELAKEDKLLSAFNYFDTTNSGVITFNSVLDALKRSNVFVDVNGLQQTFTELEIKCKRIDYEEFKSIIFSKSTNANTTGIINGK